MKPTPREPSPRTRPFLLLQKREGREERGGGRAERRREKLKNTLSSRRKKKTKRWPTTSPRFSAESPSWRFSRAGRPPQPRRSCSISIIPRARFLTARERRRGSSSPMPLRLNFANSTSHPATFSRSRRRLYRTRLASSKAQKSPRVCGRCKPGSGFPILPGRSKQREDEDDGARGATAAQR